MNRENLLILAAALDERQADLFDFSCWVGDDWLGPIADPNLCGTTACAMGLATTIPKFREMGLMLSNDSGSSVRMPMLKDTKLAFWRASERLYEASAKVFDLSQVETDYLFIPEGRGDKPGWRASPQSVAAHIRKFVENGLPAGYEELEDDDDYEVDDDEIEDDEWVEDWE